MTRRELFALLRAWGRVLADSEAPNGYSSTTTLHRISEAGKLGCWSASSKYLYDLADEMTYPSWVDRVTEVVNPLPTPLKVALRVRYCMPLPDRQRHVRAGMTRSGYVAALELAHGAVWVAL